MPVASCTPVHVCPHLQGEVSATQGVGHRPFHRCGVVVFVIIVGVQFVFNFTVSIGERLLAPLDFSDQRERTVLVGLDFTPIIHLVVVLARPVEECFLATSIYIDIDMSLLHTVVGAVEITRRQGELNLVHT